MSVPRLLVAAPSSGSGKTLLTCGLLLALKRRGLRLTSFKCGPDYVDPMFHREVLGISAGNLDLFLAGEAGMRRSFDCHAAGCDLALVEGVMGYYDGWSAAELRGSSWDVARVLRAPTVLVVNARGQSLSAVASLLGFLRMRQDSGIRGVIFNQMTSRVFEAIRPQVEALGVRALGCLPRDAALALPSRPLGLVPPEELPDLRLRLERLADRVEAGVSLDALLALAQEAAPLGPSPEAATPEIRPRQSAPPRQPVTVAVARDAAFCFHYRDNLELLER
ncbi:MAG: cobyrinate a,c-diamide synthase, partial [Clostridia bacterium]|nr:cobyrinate a,c-diamide synthase [Clostridia bacterium]